MDVPLNAEVMCTDGRCGRTTRLVVRPKTNEVTHIVVRDASYPNSERIVPVDWVTETTPERIDLSCTREQFEETQNFIETQFVEVKNTAIVGTGYLYYWMPYATEEYETIPVKHEALQPGEEAIRKGAHVDATDGRIGRVDELLVDPTTDKVTHIVLRKGHLWGARDVVVPVDQIELIEEDVVHLKLDKHAVEELPAEPVGHATI